MGTIKADKNQIFETRALLAKEIGKVRELCEMNWERREREPDGWFAPLYYFSHSLPSHFFKCSFCPSDTGTKDIFLIHNIIPLFVYSNNWSSYLRVRQWKEFLSVYPLSMLLRIILGKPPSAKTDEFCHLPKTIFISKWNVVIVDIETKCPKIDPKRQKSACRLRSTIWYWKGVCVCVCVGGGGVHPFWQKEKKKETIIPKKGKSRPVARDPQYNGSWRFLNHSLNHSSRTLGVNISESWN